MLSGWPRVSHPVTPPRRVTCEPSRPGARSAGALVKRRQICQRDLPGETWTTVQVRLHPAHDAQRPSRYLAHRQLLRSLPRLLRMIGLSSLSRIWPGPTSLGAKRCASLSDLVRPFSPLIMLFSLHQMLVGLMPFAAGRCGDLGNLTRRSSSCLTWPAFQSVFGTVTLLLAFDFKTCRSCAGAQRAQRREWSMGKACSDL